MSVVGGGYQQLGWRQLAVGFAAAGILVASLVVVAVRSSPDDGNGRDEAVGAEVTTTTTAAPPETTTTGPGGATPAPGVDAPGSAPVPGGAPTRTGTAGAARPAAAPAPRGSAPRLRLVTTRVDFGDSSTAQPLQFTNDGGSPLAWRASTSSPVLSVVPPTGALPPGATTQVSVRLDRLAGPEGRLAGTVRISSDGGEGTVEVAGSVARPPAVLWVLWDRSRVARAPCSTFPTAVSVSAAVADESRLTVVLRWRDPSGRTGSGAMTAGPNGVYHGQLGPFTSTGTVNWSVQATDALGAVARSPEETTAVDPCA
ncbi:MAG TPA: hypothetical protein VHF24_03755 [Acidimicrobiales bacterium]|nr:hypothetical protein [Acidimicrobiales bacterium]